MVTTFELPFPQKTADTISISAPCEVVASYSSEAGRVRDALYASAAHRTLLIVLQVRPALIQLQRSSSRTVRTHEVLQQRGGLKLTSPTASPPVVRRTRPRRNAPSSRG